MVQTYNVLVNNMQINCEVFLMDPFATDCVHFALKEVLPRAERLSEVNLLPAVIIDLFSFPSTFC